MSMAETPAGGVPPTSSAQPDLATTARNLGRATLGGVRAGLNPKAEAFGAAVKPHLPDRAGMKKIFAWLVLAAVVMAIIGIVLG